MKEEFFRNGNNHLRLTDSCFPGIKISSTPCERALNFSQSPNLNLELIREDVSSYQPSLKSQKFDFGETLSE